MAGALTFVAPGSLTTFFNTTFFDPEAPLYHDDVKSLAIVDFEYSMVSGFKTSALAKEFIEALGDMVYTHVIPLARNLHARYSIFTQHVCIVHTFYISCMLKFLV